LIFQKKRRKNIKSFVAGSFYMHGWYSYRSVWEKKNWR